MQKVRVTGHSVQKLEWMEINRVIDERTDGADCITFLANRIGLFIACSADDQQTSEWMQLVTSTGSRLLLGHITDKNRIGRGHTIRRPRRN